MFNYDYIYDPINSAKDWLELCDKVKPVVLKKVSETKEKIESFWKNYGACWTVGRVTHFVKVLMFGVALPIQLSITIAKIAALPITALLRYADKDCLQSWSINQIGLDLVKIVGTSSKLIHSIAYTIFAPPKDKVTILDSAQQNTTKEANVLSLKESTRKCWKGLFNTKNTSVSVSWGTLRMAISLGQTA